MEIKLTERVNNISKVLPCLSCEHKYFKREKIGIVYCSRFSNNTIANNDFYGGEFTKCSSWEPDNLFLIKSDDDIMREIKDGE